MSTPPSPADTARTEDRAFVTALERELARFLSTQCARVSEVSGDGEALVRAHHAVVPESVLEGLPAGAQVLIMTHDHAEDFALCDAALRLGDRLGGIGLIGSSAKWSRFRRLLADAGHDEAAIGRIRCPIGLPGLRVGGGGKEPAAIAVSVAAELLELFAADRARAAR